PEEDHECADERVVSRGDPLRDDHAIEPQALLGHPERGAANGEYRHQDRDHPPFPTSELADEHADAALDRPRLHRDPDESADHEDEERTVARAEQLAAVEDVDVSGGGILDAVEAVDRC